MWPAGQRRYMQSNLLPLHLCLLQMPTFAQQAAYQHNWHVQHAACSERSCSASHCLLKRLQVPNEVPQARCITVATVEANDSTPAHASHQLVEHVLRGTLLWSQNLDPLA